MNARRIIWHAAAWLLGIAVVLIVAAALFVRTSRFQEFARSRIVEAIQTATGGRAEIGSIQVDPLRLKATVERFVLRGSEPAEEAPLLTIARLVVDARLTPSRTIVGISSIEIDRPRVNVIVLPDGTTNIPQRERRGTNPLETIVDLAIGRFRINDGYARVLQQRIPFSGEGENLRVAFDFDSLAERYRGQVAINPLILARGSERLNVAVAIPVELGRNSVELNGVTLQTPDSRLNLSGSLENLDDPRFHVKADGNLALAELARMLDARLPAGRGAPSVVALNVDAGLADNGFEITTARLAMGASTVDVNGRFENVAFENGTADVRATLALNELARFLEEPPGQIAGIVRVQALASTRSANDYTIDGSVTGEGLTYRDGGVSVNDARLNSTIQADPRVVRLDPFRLEAAGGRITARGLLQERNRYQVSGDVSGFRLQEIFAATGMGTAAWGATIAGPFAAEGELQEQALRTARVELSLTPNGRAIPLRGQVTAIYDGAADSIDVGQSYLVFPASRVEFSGAVNQQMTVRLESRNLNDFRPVLALASADSQEVPVRLEQGGLAQLDATVSGKLSAPVIAGQFQLARFQVEDRRFDNLSAGFRAASNGAAIENGVLSEGPLQARLNASIGLRDWKADPDQKVAGDAILENGDLRDVLVLAGQADVPVRGALTLRANASGTVGDPQGSAEVHIRNAEAYGEAIDTVDAQASFGGPQVTLAALRVTANTGTATATATFDHPLRDFSMGTLRGRVQANQVALDRIQAIQKHRPGMGGMLRLNLEVEAVVNPPSTAQRVDLTSLNGNFGLQNVRYGNDNLGDANVDFSTAGRDVTFRLSSNFAGSSIRADGRAQLAPDYPAEAELAVQNLPVEQVLRVAGRMDIAAKGRAGVRGRVSGTIKQPTADLSLELTQAVLGRISLDEAKAHVVYEDTLIDVPSLEVRTGPNRVTMAATFRHPANDFQRGEVELTAQTNSIQLAQVQYVREENLGLAGTLQVSMKGKGHLDLTNKTFPVDLSGLDAAVAAQNLTMNGASYGGLSLVAQQTGQLVNVKLESDLAKSAVRGNAEVRIAANYPVSGEVALQGVRYSSFTALQGGADSRFPFDARAEGMIRFSGPALDPRRMTGSAEFQTLEAFTIPQDSQMQPVVLRNEGPVRFSVTDTDVEIQQARWTAPSTEVSLSGGVQLTPETAFNLNIQANADFGLVEAFDREVRSRGATAMNATVTGPLTAPSVRGRIELKDVSFQQTRMLNGISHANAVIDLSGNTARIESFTGETGGGMVKLSGSVTRADGAFRFDLQAQARDVRVRTDAGVSVTSNADIRLNGTDRGSLLSGDVDIRMVSFNARSDIGSLLTRAAPPRATPTTGGILDSIRLNIDASLGSDTVFRTGFAERLEASADVSVRGTAANPGMLGRLVISEGELLFFGTKYSMNDGVVAFYNPTRIEPILNLNLTTSARGVRVDLSVSGPVSNLSLTYRSDPPLQFTEVVSLLAAGKAPTSDPVLVAHQPDTASQTLPQMGASALLGAAIANPVAGQLQRVFGVTQLKIDPTFTSGSELPQARLTVQQQITPELTFTYVTNVARSDPQIIRVEWAIDDYWSAMATRQENGMVAVDLFYRRRFQ